MHVNPPLKEQHIIRECKKGSLKHQEQLYKHFYGFAMGICLRYSLNGEDASETINDAFIKVFNAMEQYNEAQPFKAWLRTIVVHTAIDRRRKELKHHLKAELAEVDTIHLAHAEHITSRLNAQDILKMMDSLPPLHRTVFNLYEIDGYSHEEIGTMLGFTASSSRVYLSRAKEKLKKVLKSESENHG